MLRSVYFFSKTSGATKGLDPAKLLMWLPAVNSQAKPKSQSFQVFRPHVEDKSLGPNVVQKVSGFLLADVGSKLYSKETVLTSSSNNSGKQEQEQELKNQQW